MLGGSPTSSLSPRRCGKAVMPVSSDEDWKFGHRLLLSMLADGKLTDLPAG